MSEASEIRCPQCATLYAADSARCPHCGLPNSPEQRIQQIERLLDGDQPAPPVQSVPAISSPIRQEPASAAFTQNRTPPPSAGLQWETEEGAPMENKMPRSGGWFRRHRLAFGIGGAVLAVAAIVLVVFLVIQPSMGYRSSPEALVSGLQKAIETQDIRLFVELSSPPGSNIDEMVSQNSNIFVGNEGTRIEMEDVIMGKNGRIGLIAVRMTDRFSSQMPNSSLQAIYCHKQDGLWYIDSGIYLDYPRNYATN